MPTVFIELSSSTTTKSDAIAISQPYKAANEVIVVEPVMPRFYFHLVSVDRQITDDHGKELSTLNDAYEHARKLIDKILCHLGSDDGKAWKVVALSEKYNVQIIVPFPASDLVSLAPSKAIRQIADVIEAQARHTSPTSIQAQRNESISSQNRFA